MRGTVFKILCIVLLTVSGFASWRMDFDELFSSSLGGGAREWSPLDLNPVAWWEMNGSGRDSVGTAHGVVAQQVAPAKGVKGAPGTAFDFSTSGAHVALPALPWFTGDSFTVSVWVKINPGVPGTQRPGVILGSYYLPHPRADVNFEITTQWRGRLYWTSTYDIVAPAEGVSPGGWHMLTWSYNRESNMVGYYVDGVLVLTTTRELSVRPSSEFYIGRDSRPDMNFKGVLSDLIVFDRCLLPQEALLLYEWGRADER